MSWTKVTCSCVAAAIVMGVLVLVTGDRTRGENTIRIAMPSVGMLYLPVYVADVMGYFAEEGLDAQLQNFKGGGIAMAAVLRGDMDLYIGATATTLRAANQRTDAVIAGALMTQYASNVVMNGNLARSKGLTVDSTIDQRLAALRGARIGVTGAGNGSHQLASYMLTEANLDPERDATIVFAGGGAEVIAAFSRGRIDVFTLSNPTSDVAIRDHDGFLLFNTAAGQLAGVADFLYISVNTTRGWIDANPNHAARVMAAIQRAQLAMHDPDTATIVRDRVHEFYFAKVDKGLFNTAWQAVLPAYPLSPKISRTQLERVVGFLNTFSEKPLDNIDLDEVYTNELLSSY